jgi:hypothetical protein
VCVGISTLRLDRYKMYLCEFLTNSLYGIILYGCVLIRFFSYTVYTVNNISTNCVHTVAKCSSTKIRDSGIENSALGSILQFFSFSKVFRISYFINTPHELGTRSMTTSKMFFQI